MKTRDEIQANQTQQARSSDMLRTVRALLKHKWVMLGTAIFTFTVVMAWNMRKKPVYQASTSVIIDPQAPKVLGGQGAEVVQLGSGTPGWGSLDYYNTQVRILRSRSLAERVVRRFEMHRDPHLVGTASAGVSEDQLIARATSAVQGRITVQPMRDSRVFNISITDGDPQFAADLANRVADVYTDENLRLKFHVTQGANKWLGKQIDSARHHLHNSEQALHTFRVQHNILSVALEDSQNMITNDLLKFSEALTDTKKQRLDLESRRQAVALLVEADALDTPAQATAGSASTALDATRTAYLELRRKLTQAEERYGPKHPEFLAVNVAVSAARTDLEREAKTMLRGMDAEIKAAIATENRYLTEVNSLKKQALSLNQKEVEYKRLVREAENAAAVFQQLLKRSNESGLQEQDQGNNIRILDRAMAPGGPISPNMQNATVIAIALALFLAFALGFVLDLLDRTVKSQEDVEAVAGSPVLGFVPSVEEPGQASGGDIRELYIMKHPNSTAAESCRVVRTNIMFCSPDNPLRTIMVTSSNPAEGKTMNVINLGVVMAQGGHRTLLVDTDMRRPRLHKILKVGNEKGLSTLVVGESTIEEAVKSTDLANLYVLPCGPLPPNPAELLQTERFEALAAKLKERFDRIIFDSPPLLAVTDAAILSRVADGTVLIVRAGRTTRDALFRAKCSLDNVNAHVVGVVINDVNVKSSHYAGYYYYYHNYRYHEAPTQAVEATDKA